MYVLITIAIITLIFFVFPLLKKQQRKKIGSGEHVFLNKKYYKKYPVEVRKNVLTVEAIESEQATVAYYDTATQKIVRTKVGRSELIPVP